MRPLPAFLLACLLAACTSRSRFERTATPTTATGTLGSAPYRIDIPASWDGGDLILYCHGYRGAPVQFDARAPDDKAQAFAPLGVAVAQSGYSAGGYAVREAGEDTEALRRYFAGRFGTPARTWLVGESLGGSVTMMLMETHPTTYAGGLALSAPLGPLLGYGKTLTFDQLVLFEYLFPGHLPSPARVPADFMTTWERTRALERLLDSQPAAAATLRRFSGTPTNAVQAANLDLFTYILGEQQRRWGGNPYDNRDTIYTGTGDDVAVNDGVKRYRADARAQAQAIATYSPTGRLERPLLSVRAVFDPMIGAYASDRYAELAQLAGRGELFAQQYVRESGHDQFRPQQLRAAFAELRRWGLSGERPRPGAVK